MPRNLQERPVKPHTLDRRAEAKLNDAVSRPRPMKQSQMARIDRG